MERPTSTSMYQLRVLFDEEARIQFVGAIGGRSYQTITFPKGTEVVLYVSKLPVKVENKK